MTPNKPSRGRPRGTGLNDAAQLRAIAGLIATNPDLRPTTAIKTLGITDPSVIRRLRDKFTSVEAQLIADIAPQLPLPAPTTSQFCTISSLPTPQTGGSSALAAAVLESRPSARVLPLTGARTERKSAPIPMAAVHPTSISASSPCSTPGPQRTASIEQQPRDARAGLVVSPSKTQLPDWLGMGLSLYMLSIETQYAVVGSFFRWPPLTAALKSHVTLTEMAVVMATALPARTNPTG